MLVTPRIYTRVPVMSNRFLSPDYKRRPCALRKTRALPGTVGTWPREWTKRLSCCREAIVQTVSICEVSSVTGFDGESGDCSSI